jgi:REP element-mobilizing transposase RayT
MARPLRLEYPGAVYHVIARGNERRAVFREDRDWELYLERLAHYQKRFGFRVYAYCLMTNHIHLGAQL